MFTATSSCSLCEKIAVTAETADPVSMLLDLPNTFDVRRKKYSWRRHDLLSYALIPRSAQGTTAQIDLYLCVDEDVLDDIDIYAYADRFMKENILPRWRTVRQVRLSQPVLTPPEDLDCWKVRHHALEELG